MPGSAVDAEFPFTHRLSTDFFQHDARHRRPQPGLAAAVSGWRSEGAAPVSVCPVSRCCRSQGRDGESPVCFNRQTQHPRGFQLPQRPAHRHRGWWTWRGAEQSDAHSHFVSSTSRDTSEANEDSTKTSSIVTNARLIPTLQYRGRALFSARPSRATARPSARRTPPAHPHTQKMDDYDGPRRYREV